MIEAFVAMGQIPSVARNARERRKSLDPGVRPCDKHGLISTLTRAASLPVAGSDLPPELCPGIFFGRSVNLILAFESCFKLVFAPCSHPDSTTPASTSLRALARSVRP